MLANSLRYWVSEMRVDGFRFDLGTILAREPDGFKTESGFLKAVGQDPLLAEVKLIAEPWDCGPGGYQVGGFPPGWAEWKRHVPRRRKRLLARDGERQDARSPTLRVARQVQFLRAEALGECRFRRCARRLHPARSRLLQRQAQGNGEDNRDGHSDNRSWNCGVEGPTGDPAIQSLRLRQIRNMLATLSLSQGTPMVAAGDEFGRTQNGNKNAYCQDNEISWVNWRLDEEQQALIQFFRRLMELFHLYPVLRRSRFFPG